MATKATKAASTTGAGGAQGADYDAIIVGGGHNGLVAAAYLARSGARTLVLESRPKTGGAATTEAPWPDAPDFKVTRLSYVMSLLPPTIIKDLQLERHGYKIFPMGPYYQAFPEGGSIKLYADDAQRNHAEVSRWSKQDADAMPRWDAWLAGLAEVLGPLLLTVPPNLGSRKPKDLAETLRLAWRHRGLDVRTIADVTRLMTMSIADLLDDWFESPQVKGALAVNGVIGTWAGPYEPGTAYVMAHHSIGDVGDGHLGNWGFQEGGMGAVADAIAAAARENGAEIRTGAKVRRHPAQERPGQRRGTRQRPADHGQGRGQLAAPAHRVPGPRGPGEPPGRLRRGHRALEDPQRRGQDQPGPGRTARLHRRPRHQPAGTSHRVGGDGSDHAVHRARLHRGPRRPARHPAVQRRRDPDRLRPDPVPGRLPHHVAVHPVGAGRLERAAAHRGTPGLRRPHDRLLQRGGAELQELDPAPRHRRPVRDGARLRPDRRQHLPRRAVPGAAVPHAPGAGFRGLPHAGARPVLRQLGHPRRRRRVRHPRHAGGPGRDRRPQDAAAPRVAGTAVRDRIRPGGRAAHASRQPAPPERQPGRPAAR